MLTVYIAGVYIIAVYIVGDYIIRLHIIRLLINNILHRQTLVKKNIFSLLELIRIENLYALPVRLCYTEKMQGGICVWGFT